MILCCLGHEEKEKNEKNSETSSLDFIEQKDENELAPNDAESPIRRLISLLLNAIELKAFLLHKVRKDVF